jgi:3-phosphoshikimate 1-carboxyvinyltransferase
VSQGGVYVAARAARGLSGRIRVPGDKSVSHRAVMLASLAEGSSRISGFLEGEDTRATARAFAQMGVRMEAPEASVRVVHGVGLHGLGAPQAEIDCGNAGTGMRLLAGLMAGQGFDSVLIGDESLSRRPMNRVVLPLREMGAVIDTAPEGRPPLRIHAGSNLRGIRYELPVASAQVKSALLLAGLYASGETETIEPHPTRDYSERMLRAFGAEIEFEPGRARIRGGQRLRATDVEVPADFSSAAFFIVAASLVPGSDLLIERVGINPRRTGLLDALKLMGADITLEKRSEHGGEPIADLRVRHARLRGAAIPEDVVPDMIDEFPALFIAAACAEGVTTVSGAAELRVKESDRIRSMAEGLQALGTKIEERPDGAVIEGGALHGGTVHARGDHRIAMSFAIAGQLSTGEVRVEDCANVATSFPGFVDLARACGFELAESKA